MIQNERTPLANSLWSHTANQSPQRPALRSTAETGTVIVGGGFTGLSAALHLAEVGENVTLLEAETIGWGASGRNGGQVNPGLKANPEETEQAFGADMGKRMVALSGGAAALVFDLIRRHGIECDAFSGGWIRPATNAKTLAGLYEGARQWRIRGHDVDEVTRREMTDMLGVDAYIGGIIDRRGGNIQPLNFALGLAAAAERSGARIHGDSRVTGVQAAGDTVTVTTAGGQITARRAIICTNAYTDGLMPPLSATVVPVTSVQVATAPLSENVARSILPMGHSPTDTRRLIFYFRKDATGRFIIGGRGAMGNGGILRRQEGLRAMAAVLYPQIGEAEWTHAWGGNVAMTTDHAPGLHLMAPNVVAALGYNGRGVGMATAMGTVLAKWAQDVPAHELDFPITSAKPIPFHRFRNLGVGATVATYRVLDKLGL